MCCYHSGFILIHSLSVHFNKMTFIMVVDRVSLFLLCVILFSPLSLYLDPHCDMIIFAEYVLEFGCNWNEVSFVRSSLEIFFSFCLFFCFHLLFSSVCCAWVCFHGHSNRTQSQLIHACIMAELWLSFFDVSLFRSEANDLALQIARLVTKRQHIIAVQG